MTSQALPIAVSQENPPESDTAPRNAVSCRCGAHWSGLKTCHCPRCHRTFTGLTAFDRHRDGSHTRGDRHCQQPWLVSLVDAGRAYPCWALPGERPTR